MFEQKVAFSLVVFSSHAAISRLFFYFWNRIFFNQFFQSIHISIQAQFFVSTEFSFLGCGFFVHMRHFDIDFPFFLFFFSFTLKNLFKLQENVNIYCAFLFEENLVAPVLRRRLLKNHDIKFCNSFAANESIWIFKTKVIFKFQLWKKIQMITKGHC